MRIHSTNISHGHFPYDYYHDVMCDVPVHKPWRESHKSQKINKNSDGKQQMGMSEVPQHSVVVGWHNRQPSIVRR